MRDDEITESDISDPIQPKKKRGWIKWVVIVLLLYACLGDDDDDEKRFSSQDIDNGFHCLAGSSGFHTLFNEKVFEMLGHPRTFIHRETKVSRKDSQGMHVIQMSYQVSQTGEPDKVHMAEGIYRNSDCAFQVTSTE